MLGHVKKVRDGGQAMAVCYDESRLGSYLEAAVRVAEGRPIREVAYEENDGRKTVLAVPADDTVLVWRTDDEGSEHRAELSSFAPRIYVMMVKPDKIREIIGPGGKTIRAIQSETNTRIEIEDSGLVKIAAVSKEDGEAALDFLFARGAYAERASEPLPRLVLLDLKLPKVDGLEVLREIRAHDRTRSVPVVVLTSSQEERDIAASYRLGANSFVSKPVAFDEFTSTVAELGRYWLLVNKIPAREGLSHD